MSGRIKNNLIEVRQGDSFGITLRIFSNGSVANLSDNVVRMQVRNNKNELMFEVLGDIIDETKGLIVLYITPQNSSIAVGEYNCDIQLETADGSVNTVFPINVNQIGVFRVTPQVTVKEN